MLKATFKTTQELRSFLEEFNFQDTKFCVNPDYVDAIIGISDEGKVIYDYDKMVEHLAKIYEKEGSTDDPYTDAMEWIDYNCNIPYWEIVTLNEDEGGPLENADYEEDFIAEFEAYKKAVIGLNTHGILLINSEFVTCQNIDEIESILKKYEVDYKIV